MLKGIQSERGVFHRLEFRKLNQNCKKIKKGALLKPHTHTLTHTHTHTHTHTEMGGDKGVINSFDCFCNYI